MAARLPSAFSQPRPHTRRAGAFTLLEIIVILFIIFLLMVLLVGAVVQRSRQHESAKNKKRAEPAAATPRPSADPFVILPPTATPASRTGPALRSSAPGLPGQPQSSTPVPIVPARPAEPAPAPER